MAGDEKPEPWDATKNIGSDDFYLFFFLVNFSDDRLLLKQTKLRPTVDFLLKCIVALLLFCLNLGIDVLNRSFFLLLFGDHQSLLNLNEIRGDKTECNVPGTKEIYDNMLYVVRPYRKRVRRKRT